ncbi:MAG: histidine phosphatase family protein, partial [Rhodospirillaceae bacterium]
RVRCRTVTCLQHAGVYNSAMRQVLILRHGKSDWPDGVADHDRPLKPRGRRDSARMGQWLLARDLAPDAVLTSTARRARSTARRVCDALGLSHAVIHENASLYHAGPDALTARLNGLSEDTDRVLLVGHNPGLEIWVGAVERRPVRLPTCALAVIEAADDWPGLTPQRCRLTQLIRPRELEPADADG